MAETRAGWAKYCFRQLPSASADMRAMCGRKTGDGRWDILGETDKKCPKWQKPGWRVLYIASVSFRQLPRMSVGVRDMCGQKTEDER